MTPTAVCAKLTPLAVRASGDLSPGITSNPSDPCPWELPGADLPLIPSQQAIFTPDQLRCAKGEQVSSGVATG